MQRIKKRLLPDALFSLNTETDDIHDRQIAIPPMGHLKITAQPTSGAEGGAVQFDCTSNEEGNTCLASASGC